MGLSRDSETNSIRCARLSMPDLENHHTLVMQNPSIQPSFDTPATRWSNRILILSIVGILFLTMYPFRFSFHALPGGASPFFLGRSSKGSGLLDAILNVLLFVPFGFGLAEKMKEKGKSPGFVFVTALAGGMLFSYTIEFLQLYIPERDSGWEDVFTNGSGSLAGAILHYFFGSVVVCGLTATDRFLAALLTGRRIAIVLLTYFCSWFVLAALLQKQSRLSNWKPEATLILGNDASGRNPWRGNVLTLQIWDRAVVDNANAQLNQTVTSVSQLGTPIIDYNFATLPDSTKQLQVEPKLFWTPHAPEASEHPGVSFDGKSWLSTQTNVGELIASLRTTSQFTIHLVCNAQDVANAWGRIVYVSDSRGVADLMIRQENTGLGFGFRTPLASRHAQLIWSVPSIFNDHHQRDVWYSYDGANLLLTLDGQKQRLTFKLGPGTALARIIRRVKPAELEAYNLVFYAIIFFVAGTLLGFSVLFREKRTRIAMSFASGLAFCAAAILLELILSWVAGKTFSVSSVGLSLGLGIAGVLWSLADDNVG